MVINTDSGEWYYIDAGEPNSWSPQQLDKHFRVKGRLVVDDRFKGIDGVAGTGGHDPIIEPNSIVEIPAPSRLATPD